MTLVIFLFFLSLLIIAHEFGHFWTARKVGGMVEEFSLGFPPRIFSRKIKDTIYSVGIILFGGFVKLKGEDNPNDTSGFLYLPAKRKLLIVLAGVIFNIFLAYLLFALSLFFGYPTPSEKIFISGFINKNQEISQKFKVGDEIIGIKINDQEYRFNDLNELSKFVKANYGKEVEYMILRENKLIVQKIKIPAGIYLANFTLIKEKFPRNIFLALSKTLENLQKIISGFYKIIFNLLAKEKVNLEIVGPIGIYNLFDYVKNFGLGYLFYFVAVLSLNLAFINLLPFPALDGGRALFILFEIFGKKLSYKKEEMLHRFGFIFLFALLIIISLKDIFKLWSK